tara:strand:- start:697 stop:1095 length:399 start_codon:yes stop_codon:yes gene_type:complete
MDLISQYCDRQGGCKETCPKISEETLDQFELVDTDGVEYEIWEHDKTGIQYRIDIDRSQCDFSGMDKEELIYYVYGDDVEEMEEDYDIESLRDQATDICNEDEDPNIERDYKSAEIVETKENLDLISKYCDR